jgi:hypothetical protein
MTDASQTTVRALLQEIADADWHERGCDVNYPESVGCDCAVPDAQDHVRALLASWDSAQLANPFDQRKNYGIRP